MAKKNAKNPDFILCPCIDCKNLCRGNEDMISLHLRRRGMDMSYTTWIWHGEGLNNEISNMEEVQPTTVIEDAYVDEASPQPIDEENEDGFTTLLKDANIPLYPSCTKYNRLSATVVLYKHKTMYGISDRCFSHLLEILHDMLPNENTLPESSRAVESLLKTFELGCEKIDACPNDCCLYRKEFKNDEKCKKCNLDRWAKDKNGKIQKGVPAKVLRYFPIIPRFMRMFQIAESAENLRWHHNHKSTDDIMRHPVDSLAWETIDMKWPSFSEEPRNLRLGLAADGFNPFGNLSSSYSCWPVVLTTYNLPPWLCMRKENLMLALLIPGPKQPGNDIDIYLQPLIDDLLELWNKGVHAYDAFTKSFFNLKAILMWTINDFPAYGNLAGCTTKGKVGCPICGPNTCSKWLKSSRKTVYMGHRRFLPSKHPFRSKKSWFDGNQEHREAPGIMTGSKIAKGLKNVRNNFGKGKEKGKRKRKSSEMWKKKTIFFQLPYWEHLILRHNLDVMHIEKNWCDSLVGTLLNVKGKSKDGIESRRDLEEMGIRKELHPELQEKRIFLPPGPHTLSKKEKVTSLQRMYDMSFPDGYCSNIRNCISVEECKIIGLKSHDCHVLMQQVLPVSLRGLLPEGTRNAIFRICAFFNVLCQRFIDREQMEKLEEEVVEILCLFERYFPPSFFDIMIHLAIHLGREAKIGGPVNYRWMYPFERFIKLLKGYVRNRARPEGCIVKCYLADESMRFVGAYMKQVSEMDNRPNRNEGFENDAILGGGPILKGDIVTLDKKKLQSAHRYVLFNMAEVEPYLEMHLDELKLSDGSLVKNDNLLQDRHSKEFSAWLKQKIEKQPSGNISDMLRGLAHGPSIHAMSYSGYVINGHRYHRKDAEKSRQNSGVSLEATTICRSSPVDMNQVTDKVAYYGVIKNIICLDYHTFHMPIFDCDWASTSKGVKVKEGFTMVNLHKGKRQHERDSFILASQATQVFYSRESASSNWYVVLRAPPRGFQEMDMDDDQNVYTPSSAPVDVSRLDKSVEDSSDSYLRKDCEGIYV